MTNDYFWSALTIGCNSIFIVTKIILDGVAIRVVVFCRRRMYNNTFICQTFVIVVWSDILTDAIIVLRWLHWLSFKLILRRHDNFIIVRYL